MQISLDQTAIQVLFTVMTLVFVVIFLLLQLSRYFGKKPQGEVVITRIRCGESCKYEKERSFEKGDYVGKEEGKCPKCGGNLMIFSIYSTLAKGGTKAYVKT